MNGSDLELRDLRYFVAVAEELNFKRAAERLGITQPPLSRAIQTLERRLGVALLIRTTRRAELTDAGRTLLRESRHVLDAAEAAVRRTTRAAQTAGELVVAVKPGGHAGLLKDIVAAYEAVPGAVPVRMALGGWGEQSAMLRAGHADVALVRDLFDTRGLDHEVVVAEPRLAVLRRDHPLAGADVLTRRQLLHLPVPYWPGASPRLARYRAALDLLPGAEEAPRGPRAADLVQLLEIVAMGECVAFLSASTAGQYPHADLVHVPVVDISPSVVSVAWPQEARSRAVAEFVAAALRVAARETGRGEARGDTTRGDAHGDTPPGDAPW
ncbi:LysR family transcriptional regulator [Streptomyces rubradiris]|uniref:LysR family transcriptional regulator n=1 Tax=Streptomyces rubradiris TaxID=285531 RepID=A0ABQ3RF03_STRRR|nr:LysR family transcriptional regulator [Streptomyces rubradiris]GHG97607.1 LysR family transcriptional regulator [Streptomyces rubradiris]GHI54423.1 LysR family transcriptional regulator [Streptomyces rubradiris]